eukprot:12881331-Prorocentrum_lima.AAC.1
MPTRLGGCGIANTRSRQAAAPWCLWSQTLPAIASDAGFNAVSDLLEGHPALAGRLEQLRERLARQGAGLSA